MLQNCVDQNKIIKNNHSKSSSKQEIKQTYDVITQMKIISKGNWYSDSGVTGHSIGFMKKIIIGKQ